MRDQYGIEYLYYRDNNGRFPVTYVNKEGLSFREGGAWFNFHINWKDPLFYLFIWKFRFVWKKA